MIKCQNCNNEFADDLKMCPKCGTKNENYVKPVKTNSGFKKKIILSDVENLDGDNSVAAADGIQLKTKKCPYCAEEILAEAKKCKHCGEMLDMSLSARKAENNIPKDYSNNVNYKTERPMIITIACILAIVDLLIGSLFMMEYYQITIFSICISLIPVIGLMMMKKWAAYLFLIIHIIALIGATLLLVFVFNSDVGLMNFVLLGQMGFSIFYIVILNSNLHLMD
ncbi:MAG TPA: zinc ribbon domain-containing protein [Candidatus Goldiibacteriota bacterium]|mgnify:CR=1 FL=1|nr:zinc ribbon domain-containing protein [Candidatus Goldiibacteriota bacterium]